MATVRPNYLFGDSTDYPGGFTPGAFLAETTMQSSVSQYGITWTFDSEYPVGQFVNGDHFVVGPVTVVDIDPLPEEVSGWYRNGCMTSFGIEDSQGLDSQAGFAEYDGTLNKGFPNGSPISTGNPLVVSENDVLISGVSKSTTGNRPQLDSIAILTVLETVPKINSFRPSYLSGRPKSPQWTYNDLDWAWLESVQRSRTPVQTWLSDPTTLVDKVAPLYWGLHSSSWQRQGWGRIPPDEEMYGRELTTPYGDRVLHVLLDFPKDDIEGLVVALVQIGLDIFAAAELGQTWGPDGGHFQGQYLPMVFAGKMLDDSDIYKYVDMETYDNISHENNQHFYVTQQDIDITQSGLVTDGGNWDPDSRDIPDSILAYDSSMLGMPEWGIRASQAKERNNAHWDAIYRKLNAPLVAYALALHMMGAAPDVQRKAFIDYCDRFMLAAYDGTYTDPAGTLSVGGLPNWPTSLAVGMWQEYRDSYGSNWTGV